MWFVEPVPITERQKPATSKVHTLFGGWAGAGHTLNSALTVTS
jgi:hypothetical protein